MDTFERFWKLAEIEASFSIGPLETLQKSLSISVTLLQVLKDLAEISASLGLSGE